MDSVHQKQCTKCKTPLPANRDYFSKYKRAPDGLQSVCKSCKSALARAKHDGKALRSLWKPQGYQHCSKCDTFYPISKDYFHKRKGSGTGYRTICKFCDTMGTFKIFTDEGLKVCTACKVAYPPTAEYFHRNKRRTGGLDWNCKTCRRSKARAHYAKNSKHIQELANKRNADFSQYKKQWYEENKQRLLVTARNKLAAEMGCEGTHTPQEIEELFNTQNGKCYWCGIKLDNSYHIDHIIPLSRNGKNSIDNLCCSCPYCNRSKKDKLPEEWLSSK